MRNSALVEEYCADNLRDYKHSTEAMDSEFSNISTPVNGKIIDTITNFFEDIVRLEYIIGNNSMPEIFGIINTNDNYKAKYLNIKSEYYYSN